MRYIILTILICFNVFADSLYIPSEFIGAEQTGQFYIMKSEKKCNKKNKVTSCVKLSKNYDYHFAKKEAEKIDDHDNPVNSKTEIEPCLPILDDPLTVNIDESKTAKQVCKEILTAKTCLDKFENPVIALDFSEIYCTKFLRFQKKLSGKFIVVEDVVKKVDYESKKSASESYEKLVEQELSDMKFGQKLYAMVKVLNKQKGLSSSQRKALKSSLKTIKEAMFDGDLCEARSDILKIAPDGTLISQSDIDLVVLKMDVYKKCL